MTKDYETCITFNSEEEARAFMLGVSLAEPRDFEDCNINARKEEQP